MNCTVLGRSNWLALAVVFFSAGFHPMTRAADSVLDPEFNAWANGPVVSVAEFPDGKLLVGGRFTAITGVSVTNLARLEANGAVDLAFRPPVFELVTAVALQNGTNSLVAVSENVPDVGSRAVLYRLLPDGTPDAGFNFSQ